MSRLTEAVFDIVKAYADREPEDTFVQGTVDVLDWVPQAACPERERIFDNITNIIATAQPGHRGMWELVHWTFAVATVQSFVEGEMSRNVICMIRDYVPGKARM